MIFNMSGGGGGASLNYRVLAVSSVPESAGKANDISIITETAIGDVQINCASEPTVRSDGTALQNGDVYISADLSSSIAFNAIKKNALFGFPSVCYQYDGAEWVQNESFIYQSGEWKSFLPSPGNPLNDYSWDEINRIGVAGKAAEYFSVGDEKDIVLSTAESVTLQIVGFAHDDLSNGSGKAPITFCFKNCMSTKRKQNPTNSNVGGYGGSALYAEINTEIKESLPSDLLAVMKTVLKMTSAGNQSATIVTTEENLFLLSEIELMGSATNSKAGEGSKYQIFTTNATRVKTQSGAASYWWTRSPYGTNSAAFCYINTSGASGGGGGGNAQGIALALCV